MSTADKVAEHAGNACVGAVALALGDASGGAALMVQSFGGFVLLARSLRSDPAIAARTRATQAALTALRSKPDFARADMGRAAFLLTDRPIPGLTPEVLLKAIGTAKGIDIAPPIAGFLMSQFPFDGDDPATIAAVRAALEAAARACAAQEAFQDDMRSLMLMNLVREANLQGQLLRTVEAKVDRVSDQLAEMREMMVRQTSADRPGLAKEHGELIFALAER